MMKFKDNQIQPEFFPDIPSLTKREKRKERPASPALEIVLSYDNAIFLGIFLVMMMVFAFSFGVEWGRRPIRKIKDIPVKKPIVSENKTPIIKSAKREEALESMKEDRDKRRYTIQVATYRKETFAQREASSLKKLGLQIHIVRRGRLIEVCVGDYSNREEAKRLLKELKKRYGDCFIKNL